MLHHHTTDLGERVNHIAEREANEECRRVESYKPWFRVYFRTYEETLKEFQPELEREK